LCLLNSSAIRPAGTSGFPFSTHAVIHASPGSKDRDRKARRTDLSKLRPPFVRHRSRMGERVTFNPAFRPADRSCVYAESGRRVYAVLRDFARNRARRRSTPALPSPRPSESELGPAFDRPQPPRRKEYAWPRRSPLPSPPGSLKFSLLPPSPPHR